MWLLGLAKTQRSARRVTERSGHWAEPEWEKPLCAEETPDKLTVAGLGGGATITRSTSGVLSPSRTPPPSGALSLHKEETGVQGG